MLEKISVRRLTVGLHISLKSIPWFKHPFMIPNFTITKSSEIREILSLGYETIFYDPDKSKSKPLAQEQDVKVPKASPNIFSKISFKSKKASELRKRRQKFQEMEQRFRESLERTSSIVDSVRNRQIGFYEEVKSVAGELVETFFNDVNLSVEHINVSAAADGQHFHGLNVMVLSMMLGRQLGLEREQMEQLGFGAMVHDIALVDVPRAFVESGEKAEQGRYLQHPKEGVSILSKLPDINREVMKIVYQHHEYCDGSGFPKHLKEDSISDLSKIVTIADFYDRLINTRTQEKALPPHTALAYMFAKKRDCFDAESLGVFIKMLGVYPAGTICRFTSGDIGAILSVDPNDPMHPEFIIYNPTIPKNDAIIYKLGIDLDLEVEKALKLSELDSETMSYLDSRGRIQYFPSEK